MKNPLYSPLVAIPVLILCFAKIASHLYPTPVDTSIVVALSDEAVVEFIPEGE
ncbi:MAG: hypothetical protein VXW76_07265 [Actinomycetota bacterium]|nr:hypothetical protein [Actinomycetota bacterium]